jgi:hypothetical protein
MSADHADACYQVPDTTVDTSLRVVFRGRRGRLLAALLLAEFGAAVQSAAYSTVLPIASRELDGSALYGATLAAGALTTIAVLAAGPRVFGALSPARRCWSRRACTSSASRPPRPHRRWPGCWPAAS